nr:DUF6298 domain-containing protein [Bacteroides acidifaciens]
MKNTKLFMFAACALLLTACGKQTVKIMTPPNASNRVLFGAEQLQTTLDKAGYQVMMQQGDTTFSDPEIKTILLTEVNDTTLEKEGFHITTAGNLTKVSGRDGSGVIYGCRELIDRVNDSEGKLDFPEELKDGPEMVLRGACVGLQKMTYLPGHGVYEYPYTPESFPWFYDKEQWIKYLDMLVANRMNSLYLWNGHPFASLVKLEDYPFALEVDEETFKMNEEMFSFLTEEADKRGIFVIQMFYNIILSKPFAEHYGLKTQDRNRPITPLIADYTRKSIAAFIEKYPNVGLLVCLGEAMCTVEDDVEWFTKTIIPGVKDGLQALGRTDEPPLLLRAHDTDCKLVMDAALPLYKNLYTMHKYNGESLTTYEPRGPWLKIHTDLSSLGSIHISNVHILANLEPFRWGSPDFVQKAVQAMHNVHGANALHLYPQASYWDWPYTADKLPNNEREFQLERDWIWYQTWGRYAWNCHRDRTDEMGYWDHQLGKFYGTSDENASNIRVAYEESGEIAPKLLRRFGITEGNRQTLLLGMFMSQLVNPYKYTIYPGFYESCGPEGEKLIEYVEKEWKQQPHVGEMPLDIVAQAIEHGDKAVAAIDKAAGSVSSNKDEFARLQNDMHCYREFAYAFNLKVKAAKLVLDYQWGKEIKNLEEAIPLMEQSLEHYRKLVELTDEHYLYANRIEEKKFSPSVASAGIKSVDDIREKKNTFNKLSAQPEVTITNGRIQKDGALLVGGSHTTPWWNGKLKTSFLKKASPAITRFVPGREGLGLTDRIDSVVNFMKLKNILVFDQNYGLWYDRRRDDHERVRRRDGDVWGPFYEQPFGRSGQGTAWEGLSKYDLNRPNAWYWARLKEFAEKGSEDGLLLFHENYFQHNIIEAGAHWVDSPWRSSNNINQTGFPEPVPFAGDKRIFVADMFYDITHPVRRELHRQYIRQCLDNFADNSNVIQLTSAEFTGPLHFVQFWLDVIAEWEAETGKKAKVALSTTKDVQDAILADSKRAAVVDIIDIRYWHYKTDGIFAPEGGKNMAPRQHMRKMKVGKVTFSEAYKAVNEYRQKFPQKAVTFYAQNYPAMGWAIFMAGGSCPVIPCTDKVFLRDAAIMEVEETNTDEYKKLVKSDIGSIIYSKSGTEIPIQLSSGKYALKYIHPSSGKIEIINNSLKINGLYKLKIPNMKEGIYWFHKL